MFLLKCLGVVYSGDNCMGSGDGDDEVIFIDMMKFVVDVEEILVVVMIDQVEVCWQNFGQVCNSYIQIVDEVLGVVIVKYVFEEDFLMEMLVQVGSFYCCDGYFMFKVVGVGYNCGFGDFVCVYGGVV